MLRLDGSEIEVGTVFCIGRNVFAHALELGNEPPREPLVFLKSAGAVRSLTDGVVAFSSETFHHEAEVVLVIGEAVPMGSDPGWSCVEGVALGLDLTRRGVQKELKTKGLPWTIAKSFAGSAPIGPVVPVSAFEDPDRIQFELEVEGTVRQRGDLGELSFSVPYLLRTLSQLQPLRAGDLVFTGTPAGVGEIRVGDRFQLRFIRPSLSFSGVL